MDKNSLWLLLLAIATPVAGVIGFAIQLRQVRNIKLENEKLVLEIAALKNGAEVREQRVQRVSTDEVLRYGREDVRFSRDRGPNPGPYDNEGTSWTVGAVLVVAAVLFIGSYAIYDIYRLIRWLIN